jgi:hypothetical protein
MNKKITTRIMLLSNLKCLLNLPEIEQGFSDWLTLIVNYKKSHSKFDPRVLGHLYVIGSGNRF